MRPQGGDSRLEAKAAKCFVGGDVDSRPLPAPPAGVQAAKVLGDWWSKLTDEDKAPYMAQAKADRDRWGTWQARGSWGV